MQEQRIEGSKIIERLVESSTSFNQKTKFSQEKFIKKKTKKYCQYIKIRQPSIRLILQIRSRDIPKMKSLNLRVDSLAQIINTCNIRSGGKVSIYVTDFQISLLILNTIIETTAYIPYLLFSFSVYRFRQCKSRFDHCLSIRENNYSKK